MTGSNNHYSLISLNTNGLDSPIKQDYYTQQNSQSPKMEKPRYSMTKPSLPNIYPQTQPYKG